MKLTLFADAHIYTREASEKVENFLEEHDNVVCLGDLFDTPEDMRKYGKFVRKYDFVWLKGNHEYWLELPEELRKDGVLLTHGHKMLISWIVERLFVKFTPYARKYGVFEPAIWFGRIFRGSALERIANRAIFYPSTAFLNPPFKLVVMGHLHNFLKMRNIVVLPRFPAYGILSTHKLVIKSREGAVRLRFSTNGHRKRNKQRDSHV